jgi:hypothetical protein
MVISCIPLISLDMVVIYVNGHKIILVVNLENVRGVSYIQVDLYIPCIVFRKNFFNLFNISLSLPAFSIRISKVLWYFIIVYIYLTFPSLKNYFIVTQKEKNFSIWQLKTDTLKFYNK